MNPCVLTEDGYCPRHNVFHRGAFKAWALSETPKGEKYRQLWDRYGSPEKPVSALPPPPDGEVVEYPCAKEQLTNVTKATAEWIAAGMPKRTDEECERIHKICEGCKFFDKGSDRCRACGCGLSASSKISLWTKIVGLADGIKMATHHCPKSYW